ADRRWRHRPQRREACGIDGLLRNFAAQLAFAPTTSGANKELAMSQPSRRSLLAGAALFTAGTAMAQDQIAPQPVEGDKGAAILGPRNPPVETENLDALQPPDTDRGGMPNLKFSFAAAHVKMRDGGWSREVTQRELPIATTIAGVNMRLAAGGVRELHW